MNKTDLDNRIIELELELSNLKSGIVAKQAAKNTLDDSYSKFLTLANHVSAHIAYVNIETLQYEFVNELFEKSFAIPKEKIIGSHIKDIIGETNYKFALKYIKEVKLGKSCSYENSFELANGKRWIQVNYSPVFNSNNDKVVGIAVVSYDITERKNLENMLNERNQFLTKLNNSLESVVFTVDLESRNIEYVNNRVEAVFGYSPEECIGNGTRFLYPDKQSFIDYGKQMQNAIQKNQEFLIVENTLRKKNGELFSTDITTSFLDKTKVVAVITDITGKKKAEQDLIKAKEIAEENESKFRNLFENSPIGKSMTGIDGSLHVNKSFCEIVGYSEEELAGQKWKEISYPDDIPLANEKIQSLLNGETDKVFFEKRYIHKNGNIIWADLSVYLQMDKQNKPEYFITTIIDITERKHAEKSLRSSQEMLLSSQSAANICSYSTNLNLTEINKSYWECSPEFYKIFGIDETYPHAIEGWIGFLHPEYREDVAAYHESVILDKKSFNREYKIIRINDGVERWVQGTGELVYDEKGTPIRMYGAIQDITERKQQELQLQERTKIIENKNKELIESEIKLKQSDRVFNLTLDMFCIAGFDGYFKYLNPAWERTLGWSIEELLSKPWLDFVHPDDAEKTENIKSVIVGGKEVYIFENRYICKDGSIRWFSWNSHPFPEENIMIGAVRDITEKKEKEAELIKAKEKAEESDRLKSAFLTNMSHEIRTPMNGILGFAELLKTPNLTTEEQNRFIGIIGQSGQRMLNTINDIIGISKIESGLVNVNIQEANINGKMEFTYKFFKPLDETKGIQLSFKNGLPDKEAIIKTDNEKVYGILTNLVRNAIKFTSEGSVEFGYIKKGKFLEFYVKDTGIGISEQQKEIIFERFRQGSESNNRSYEGSGLGLAISKSYVEMLGGKIWVESQEGKGSTFYFTIPYNVESETDTKIKDNVSPEPKDAEIKNLKTLIVEDDEISYSLLSLSLDNISAEVLHAITGVEAVEACRNNPDLDLVLMDIRMPEMNGLEATHQIRQFNKDLVIIAQTAYGFESDSKMALEAGCNDYISKPIEMALLNDMIKKHCNK